MSEGTAMESQVWVRLADPATDVGGLVKAYFVIEGTVEEVLERRRPDGTETWTLVRGTAVQAARDPVEVHEVGQTEETAPETGLGEVPTLCDYPGCFKVADGYCAEHAEAEERSKALHPHTAAEETEPDDDDVFDPATAASGEVERVAPEPRPAEAYAQARTHRDGPKIKPFTLDDADGIGTSGPRARPKVDKVVDDFFGDRS